MPVWDDMRLWHSHKGKVATPVLNTNTDKTVHVSHGSARYFSTKQMVILVRVSPVCVQQHTATAQKRTDFACLQITCNSSSAVIIIIASVVITTSCASCCFIPPSSIPPSTGLNNTRGARGFSLWKIVSWASSQTGFRGTDTTWKKWPSAHFMVIFFLTPQKINWYNNRHVFEEIPFRQSYLSSMLLPGRKYKVKDDDVLFSCVTDTFMTTHLKLITVDLPFVADNYFYYCLVFAWAPIWKWHFQERTQQSVPSSSVPDSDLSVMICRRLGRMQIVQTLNSETRAQSENLQPHVLLNAFQEASIV